jgi:hypothetical protein
LYQSWAKTASFVKTASSSFHSHFKEPLRFSLLIKEKKILITFKGFRFLEKNIPMVFSLVGSHENYNTSFQ